MGESSFKIPKSQMQRFEMDVPEQDRINPSIQKDPLRLETSKYRTILSLISFAEQARMAGAQPRIAKEPVIRDGSQ